MGCDIHILCEVKENGKWKVNNKLIFPNPSFTTYKNYREEDIKKGLPEDKITKIPNWAENEFQNEPESNRNYDWFGVLADVRNGRGFAGCVTGEGFNIISEPKGVAEDSTEEWKKTVEEWEGNMHSHSYISLEEFEKFDWKQTTEKQGVITLEEYKKLRNTNDCPDTWCGGVSGGNIETINSEKADNIIDNNIKLDKEYYVIYKWKVLYSDWFNHKITNVIEPMKKLKEEYEDVRIVFGFDN